MRIGELRRDIERLLQRFEGQQRVASRRIGEPLLHLASGGIILGRRSWNRHDHYGR